MLNTLLTSYMKKKQDLELALDYYRQAANKGHEKALEKSHVVLWQMLRHKFYANAIIVDNCSE
jgi:TPR repeat protein